jgi:hypothetical protein
VEILFPFSCNQTLHGGTTQKDNHFGLILLDGADQVGSAAFNILWVNYILGRAADHRVRFDAVVEVTTKP